jgi:signal peptidase I
MNADMNVLKLWVIPIVIAVSIVIVLRMYLFTFYVVQSENMENTLHKNDIVLIQKRGNIKPNDIVLLSLNKQETLSRCIAVPNDTMAIRKGEIIINRKDFKYSKYPKAKIKKSYVLYTDSSVQKLLPDKNINFNKYLSYFGVYQINTDYYTLKKIREFSEWYSIKKSLLPAGLYDDCIQNFVNRFYWNTDNTGLIIIPAKGKKIELNLYNYELYKGIINHESNKKYIRMRNKIYVNGKAVKYYTFIYNYYFVINDNRTSINDSRYIGFIREDKIAGKLLVKF